MRALALFAALAPAACDAPARPGFPVGLFGVDRAEELRFLAREGFDAFQTYSTAPERLQPLARAARETGAVLLASPWELMKGTSAPRGHAGMVWYLQDEPDVHGVDVTKLAEMERRVRAWSPGSPTAFVLGDGRTAKAYPGVGDFLMVDWYPVPHLPLQSLGDHVRMTAEAAGGRPVWAVVQAMDWRDFPQRDPKKPRVGRFPDILELRFMSYDAVLNGASGLWYFVYSISERETLADRPENLFALLTVIKEMRAMAPVFASGRPLSRLEVVPPGSSLSWKAWRWRGRDYLVLVNRGTRNEEVPAPLLSTSWRQLFLGHRDMRGWGAGTGPKPQGATLRGGEVLVLEGARSWRSRLEAAFGPRR